VHRGGDRRLETGHRLLDVVDRLDDVDAGLFEHDEEDVAFAVAPRRLGVVGGSIDRIADVADANRRAIAIGDDDVVPRFGVQELVVVEDGEGLSDAVDRALGAVGRGHGDLAADVLELQVLLDQLGGVDLDAHRRLLLAADAHQRHAGDLTDLLGEDVLGRVVDVDDRRGVGGDRENEDRRVGRIDLSVGRRTWAGSSAIARTRR
jgi:hypothetical protein